MKISGKIGKYYHYAFPMQAVLVTCNDEKESTNVITLAWHTPISKDPTLYGISVAPKRYSHDLIAKTKEFVLNFVPYELVEKVHFCGTRSGRTVKKIEETQLTLMPSEKVRVPSIQEGYAHLECKLVETLTLGDHTFFVGEVVFVRADKNAFVDDVLDVEKNQPLYYIGDNQYTTVDPTEQRTF